MKQYIRMILFSAAMLLLPLHPGMASPAEEPAGSSRFIFAPGSTVRFEHLSIEDGLSQNAGLAIFQDSRGYLWIGTQDGLNRYDGYAFKVYKHDPEDPGSLGHNSILEIAEDSQGRLWIGTWGGGLNRYDPVTETFTRYLHDENDPGSLAENTVTSIYEDSAGRLWIGTLDGLDLFDEATSIFSHYRNDPQDPHSLSSSVISLIFEDSSRRLWIGTGANGLEGSGLNRFDPASGKAVRYRHDPTDPDSLSSDNIASIYEDGDGMFWIATGGFSLRGGGLNRFDPGTGRATRFVSDPDDPHSLGGDDLMSLWGDSSGILWIGTWTSGLHRMDLAKPGVFTRYRNDPFFADSLSGDEVWSLFEDRSGILWVGTSHSGINKLSANGGQFSLYRNNPSDPASLGINAIGSFAEDKRGDIWIATWGAGLDRFNPDSGQFSHYRHDPENRDSLSDDLFMDVYVDQYNIVWAGTLGKGLNRLDPATERAAFYLHDPKDPFSIADDNIASIVSDNGGGLWIAADGSLWLGTQLGLNRLDPATNTFKHYTEKQGLPNNVVVGILEDRDGDLWLTTNNGLAQFDPQTAGFTVYDSSDGLQSNEFNSNAFYRASDGSMYIGGINGFNRFKPEQIKPNPTPPQVRVTKFEVFNEPLAVDLSGREPIYLDHKQDFISFEFSAFDFQAPQKNRYAYMLEGFNEGWIQAGNRRYATYTNLPGGEYVFRVKASNSDGTWNEAGAAIPVIIRPPIWQTHWFIGSLVIVLGALVAGGFRWRLTSIREQTLRLETEVAERTAELRDTNRLLEREVEQRKRAEAELAKRAAEQLQQSEERFRVMFENAGIGTALIGMDRRPLEANAAMIQMTGYSPDEFFQLSGADLSYPEDADIGVPELQEVLAGRLNTYQIEKRYVRKSGQVYWVRLTNSVVRAPDGQPQYFVTMVEDINEQKRSAEELRKSQARFQAIFDNVAVGVAVMGLDRRPIAFNAATERIVGYAAEELRNIDPRMLAVPEDRDLDSEQFRGLIEGRRDAYVMERRYVHRDGRVFWARVNFSLVRDLDGRPDYLVGIIEDIDEQRRASERLAEQEAEYLLTLQQRVAERTRRLEEANLRLQHEIEQRAKIEKELAEKAAQEAVSADRTRLARDLHDAVTQTLFSSSLIAEVLPDLWEMDADEARKSTEELRQLTRGALAEMRTLLLELRPATLTQTRLSDLIKQLCEAFIGRSRLPITLSIEGECALPPEVQVAIYRIAQESLNNVFKYARATRVQVNLFLSPKTVHFETIDNGTGFDMSTSRPTSLGMRIMRERAEAIGASFRVTSQVGSGTCVEVTWSEKPDVQLRVL